MKEFYSKLDFMTAIWWCFLIFLFIVYPIYCVYSGHLKINNEIIEPMWWMYMLAIFVFDWIIIILLIALSMLGMLLAKVHNFLTND